LITHKSKGFAVLLVEHILLNLPVIDNDICILGVKLGRDEDEDEDPAG